MSELRELLLQSKTCPICEGTGRTDKIIDCPECHAIGTVPDSNARVGCDYCEGKGTIEELCKYCFGAGAIVDGRIVDAIKNKIQELVRSKESVNYNRKILSDIIEEIFNIVEDKIDDSYSRGMRDGIKETVSRLAKKK